MPPGWLAGWLAGWLRYIPPDEFESSFMFAGVGDLLQVRRFALPVANHGNRSLD
jgi:hypothetical protein